MRYLLAGDIGGTKTILRLVAADQAALKTCYEKEYVSKAFPDLVPMVEAFLAAAQVQGTDFGNPSRACFAIAGPVVNNTSKLTNLTWNLEGDRLAHALELESAELINDFAAVGYGVLGLTEKDLYVLQAGTPSEAAPIAVIGAGTGLGQGFLIKQGKRFQVFASEGGARRLCPPFGIGISVVEILAGQTPNYAGLCRTGRLGAGGRGNLPIFARSRHRLRNA